MDNIKNNFAKFWQSHKGKESPLKAFFKLGAVHTARGMSFSGNLEVGNMVYELANLNQSQSFSMITFPKYIFDKKTGEIEDVSEEEDRELLEYAYSDQWTVIDLKKLKELSIRNNIQLSQSTNSYIQKYDAVIIPPATDYSEKIY